MPQDPDALRKKADEYRAAAAAEMNVERRRAYMLIASEYDQLAVAIEKESDQSVDAGDGTTDGTRSNRAPGGHIEQ